MKVTVEKVSTILSTLSGGLALHGVSITIWRKLLVDEAVEAFISSSSRAMLASTSSSPSSCTSLRLRDESWSTLGWPAVSVLYNWVVSLRVELVDALPYLSKNIVKFVTASLFPPSFTCNKYATIPIFEGCVLFRMRPTVCLSPPTRLLRDCQFQEE